MEQTPIQPNEDQSMGKVEKGFSPKFEMNLQSAARELDRTGEIEALIPDTKGMKLRKLEHKAPDKAAFSTYEYQGTEYVIYEG